MSKKQVWVSVGFSIPFKQKLAFAREGSGKAALLALVGHRVGAWRHTATGEGDDRKVVTKKL